MTTTPSTSLDHFHHELLLARREALALLRRAMQSNGADTAPTPAQIRAAIAILHLPKHVCHAGDEAPPQPPLSSPPSTPTPERRCAAHPRVSSSPSPSAPTSPPPPSNSNPSLPYSAHLYDSLPASLAHIPRDQLTPQMVIAAIDAEIAQLHRKLADSLAKPKRPSASTPRPPPQP